MNALFSRRGASRGMVVGSCFLLWAMLGMARLGADDRPNILFCIADDWGWPHAGIHGDPVVRTPAFDRIAREGVLFENAFVTSPSCTPSRSSILTGQYHWRLDQAANLHSSLDPKHPVFPQLLEDAGYFVGHWRKAWGPGKWAKLGQTRPAVGRNFKGFQAFLNQRPEKRPFCFWLGAVDPHRPYEAGTGASSGMDLAKIQVPADLPDHEIVRSDIADYYFEVQRFDRDVAEALALLEATGELENTIVVMTGDHGMPFPRHKCNLYDSGTHVPLAIRWGKRVPGDRRVSDFVSLADLAPTFLEAASLPTPEVMTGKSLLPLLGNENGERIDPARDHVLVGRERHTQCQETPNSGGYPMRAIRTDDFLYIINFEPNRWPAGTPDATKAFNGRIYGDCDGGPTKDFLLSRAGREAFPKLFELAFAKRPAEELYVLADDPGQLTNVAGDTRFTTEQAALKERLMTALRETDDPRVVGGAEVFDTYPYHGRDRPLDDPNRQ